LKDLQKKPDKRYFAFFVLNNIFVSNAKQKMQSIFCQPFFVSLSKGFPKVFQRFFESFLYLFFLSFLCIFSLYLFFVSFLQEKIKKRYKEKIQKRYKKIKKRYKKIKKRYKNLQKQSLKQKKPDKKSFAFFVKLFLSGKLKFFY